MTSNLMKCAREAVQLAASITRSAQENLQGRWTQKTDRSPVTIADLAVQVVLVDYLSRHTPDIPVLGEEDASALRDADGVAVSEGVVELARPHLPALTIQKARELLSGQVSPGRSSRYWVLDPIDGTKGFLRGDQYAIALGLCEEGVVTHGVLGCPNLVDNQGRVGSMLWGSRGHGAYTRSLCTQGEQRIDVSTAANISTFRFCESVEASHSAHGWSESVAAKLGVHSEPVRIDSQCKYALLSRGDAEIYLRLPVRKGYEEKVWDHAAGVVIIEEAGGRVTDIDGRALDFSAGRTLKNNRGIIASNGFHHERIVEAVQAFIPDELKRS